MEAEQTEIPEVLLIKPDVYGDERGYFKETFHQQRYAELGIKGNFVQDNVSFSSRGVLRGLHYQWPKPQGKLLYVLQGEIFDVAVDIRADSPTFGKWVGRFLSADNHHQLWIPEGFAHGFLVTSDTALITYKCTDLYHPADEGCVQWDDPTIGIDWPLDRIEGAPSLSGKDQQGKSLADSALTPDTLSH
ncbi:MAG: dTDP-4-dehydrorhamnose 3,5-epimerase [Candidatus Reddybacter sp.]